jgi:hypothetical protein
MHTTPARPGCVWLDPLTAVANGCTVHPGSWSLCLTCCSSRRATHMLPLPTADLPLHTLLYNYCVNTCRLHGLTLTLPSYVHTLYNTAHEPPLPCFMQVTPALALVHPSN